MMFNSTISARILIAAAGAAAIAIMVAGFLYLNRNIVPEEDPFTAVADDAVIIVRAGPVKSFLSSLNREKGLWPDMNRVLNSRYLVSQAGYLDSLIGIHPRAGMLAAGKSLHFSIHPSGKDRYEPVFYLGLPTSGEQKAFEEIMDELLSGVSAIGERTFNRTTIREASFNTSSGNKVLSWTVTRGLLILGFSPLLIENAVLHLDESRNIADDPAFQRVHATSRRDVDANIYINLKLFPGYISSFTTGEQGDFLTGFKDLASWAELDLHLRDDGILLNGFSASEADGSSYLDIFRGQAPVTAEIEDVIPGHASAFIALGLTDKPLFHTYYLGWLEQTGRLPGYLEMEEEFQRLTGHTPSETFHSFMDKEAAMVFSGWDDPGKKGDSFLVIQTRSREMALGSMIEMLKHHSSLSGEGSPAYKQEYRVDSDISFDLYSFPFSNAGGLLFGALFGRVNTSWFSFVGNYLVFSDSPDALARFLRAGVLGQTLSASSRFRDFSEYLVSRNNFYFYSNITRSAGLFAGLLRDDLAGSLENNLEQFRNFSVMSVQFNASGSMPYNNIYLRYSPEAPDEPATEWQTLLDTVAVLKPVLLVNHNTGENEIFVQDAGNTIYLISSSGRILWKKPLSGQISGNVYQIDYYRNNRLQMMFNTSERIYLIDRNGNDVGRYPVRLPSPATNGIAVFDYDNNRDYRIFLASEDKSVTVRSKEGNIVTGWQFPGTEHNVYGQIRYIRSDNRDYIVFADRHRVYITDRRGSIRVRPDSTFPVSAGNEIAFEARTSMSEPRLAITDTTGTVWHIYLDGKTESVTPGNYTSGHFFDFRDVNADGHKNYIFLDRNRLDVWLQDGSLLFSHEFGVSFSSSPDYYHFSDNDRKLGVVSGEEGLIYLIDSDGNISEGFPYAGTTGFTIGFLGRDLRKFSLIVGSGNNFLYNYTVN